MTSRWFIGLFCGAASLAGCTAAQKQPFDARACARSCIEMAAACKASCLKTVDPTRERSGSGDTCERTCQTQRDTCDLQCMQGKQP
jgi:hypothetical protein